MNERYIVKGMKDDVVRYVVYILYTRKSYFVRKKKKTRKVSYVRPYPTNNTVFFF